MAGSFINDHEQSKYLNCYTIFLPIFIYILSAKRILVDQIQKVTQKKHFDVADY